MDVDAVMVDVVFDGPSEAFAMTLKRLIKGASELIANATTAHAAFSLRLNGGFAHATLDFAG